jgi:hypothetical protein
MMITSTRETEQNKMSRLQYLMTQSVKELAEQICLDDHYREDVSKSRFYRFIAALDDNPAQYMQVLESRVSNFYGMSGCHDDDVNFFWLDDDGAFHKVSAGTEVSAGTSEQSHLSSGQLDEFYEENPAIMYSWNVSLIANNKRVGTVTYTDH